MKDIARDIPVTCLALTDSTNNEAKAYIASVRGRDTRLFLAERQTHGRGRQEGKGFFSPEGGLYMSLLCPYALPEDGLALTAAAAVAVCEALRPYTEEPRIKWVNDIYYRGGKLCGILCEQTQSADGVPHAVIGIGVNLRTPPQGFPAELKGRAAALDMDTDKKALALEIASLLLSYLERGLTDASLYARYRGLSMVIGKRVIYTEQGESRSAQALDIAPDGSLIVNDEQGIRRLNSGAVSLLSEDMRGG